MNIKICRLLVAAFSLQFPVSLCGAHHGSCPDFTATFVGVIDQTVSSTVVPDPEMTFFKEVLGFRENDIQHAIDDAIKFFNKSYGLDFSLSPPNEQGGYVFENARMSFLRLNADICNHVLFNNWIQTGNTRTTGREIQVGLFIAIFVGDQLLHGSYGGVDGIPAGEESVEYGYHVLDVCDQSPVIIQVQTVSPIGVNGGLVDYDIYNQVLGHGKALGLFILQPDQNNPVLRRLVSRLVYTYPAS